MRRLVPQTVVQKPRDEGVIDLTEGTEGSSDEFGDDYVQSSSSEEEAKEGGKREVKSASESEDEFVSIHQLAQEGKASIDYFSILRPSDDMQCGQVRDEEAPAKRGRKGASSWGARPYKRGRAQRRGSKR